MKSYEMVETLSDKAKVTLEEAKNALDSTNWDMDQAETLLKQRKTVNPAPQNTAPQNTAPQNSAPQNSAPGTTTPGSPLNSLQGEKYGGYYNPNQPVISGKAFNKDGGAQSPNYSQNYNYNPGGQNPGYSQNYNYNPGYQGTSVSEMFGRACGNAENVIDKGLRSNFIVSKNGKVLFQLPLIVSAILGVTFLPTVAAGLFVGLCCDCKYSIGDNRPESNPFDNMMNKAKQTTDKMKEDFITGRDSTKRNGL